MGCVLIRIEAAIYDRANCQTLMLIELRQITNVYLRCNRPINKVGIERGPK